LSSKGITAVLLNRLLKDASSVGPNQIEGKLNPVNPCELLFVAPQQLMAYFTPMSNINPPLRSGALQKALDDTLGEMPRRAFAGFLKGKLQGQGVNLSEADLAILAQHALDSSSDSVTIDEQETDKKIIILFTEEDQDEFQRRLDDLSETVPALAEGFIENNATEILESLKQQWPSVAQEQREIIGGFEQRLNDRWGRGIEGLRMLAMIASEFGDNIAEGIDRPALVAHRLAVLRLLHARSCQVTQETIALLSGGFADGAMARWRTLHEIAAVALVIGNHGEDLAERYLAHEVVEVRKAALQYQTHASRLGQQRLNDAEMRHIEKQYQSVIAKYGPDFKGSQGWAAATLGKRDPTIADILEASKIDHLGPYYRMASHNVHANPKGVFFKLGLMGEMNVLLAGPSNAGLADPGDATARSLVQISTT